MQTNGPIVVKPDGVYTWDYKWARRRPQPGFSPAETLFLAGFVLGAAMRLAYARWWRLW